MIGDQRLDRPPLILAQPGLAAGIPDEAGQDGIGSGTQIFVAHAPMQPDATDNARTPARSCG